MLKTVILGLLIPFIGTAAGSACVFFLNRNNHMEGSAYKTKYEILKRAQEEINLIGRRK